MWKKAVYAILLIIVSYFLYTIFLKKIEAPEIEKIQKEMKAKNVVYKLKDDAVIYADEQIGSNSDEIIKFTGVTVELLKKNMLLVAKEAEINTKTSNIEMRNEVVGRTKDDEWNIFTNKLNYEKAGEKLYSDTRTRVVNNKDGRELEGDRVETTVKFEEVVGTGNVVYKGEGRELVGDKIKYNDIEEIAEAEGNVKYKDEKSNITFNKGIYYIKKKQVDATGNVVYDSQTLTVSANHIFYDEVEQVANADNNGKFLYKPKNSNGTFKSGVYDLKGEVLTTKEYFTMNYDDYKMSGTDLVYTFSSGDAVLNKKFDISKQNFNVSGENGTANTINKHIFSNKMVMTSIQGDKITSDIGEGSFEKQEFRFDGNIKGKIRGNVKNFMTNPTKLVDSEAVHFTGNKGKMYFVTHNNNMSITRSELKEKVHVEYKELVMDSEYNEIDTGKNTILARDKVIVDFRNETQMTSNFLHLNLDKEEGVAQNNVKIVSKIPKFSNINTSADKAIINIPKRIVNLIGNVTTYQGKTKISSNSAAYDINKKILENNKNIKMNYVVQTTENQGKSDPKNINGIDDVLKRIVISQKDINNKSKIELPKNMKANNGVVVSLKWESSNSTYLPVTGKINKQFYGGESKNVDLKVIATAGNDKNEKVFKLIVPSETVKEMLERASKNINKEQRQQSTVINIHKGTLTIPVIWNGDNAILKYVGVEHIKSF